VSGKFADTYEETEMKADTKSISIEADPVKVARFLADPQNLPRWAVGFAKSVRSENGRWLVKTGVGEVGLRVAFAEAQGTVDFWISPAPGLEALAASRVLPRGEGSEYVFTQFQAPGMPEDAFNQSIKAVERELTVLKALLEIECPL
jgi:hypothetical protein